MRKYTIKVLWLMTKLLTERANGLTPKGLNLVPISIITGTKQNKGTKRGIK